MIVYLWMSIAAASPPCPDDSVALLEASMAAVDEAYGIVDEAAFDRATKSLTYSVACLDTDVPPGSLARLHRSMGLASFVNGQVKAARRSLAAARLADPAWTLEESDFPGGHPYRQLYDSATDPGPVQPIGDIPPEVWVVDGIERKDAPVERGFLLQIRGEDGILWAGYLWSFDEIPDRGQHDSADPTATPRDLDLQVGVLGRYRSAVQEADKGTPWTDQQAAGLGGGLAVSGRYTPVAFVGAEARIEALGGDDPVTGGGLGVDIQLTGLLGTAALVGESQLFASARFGGDRSVLRAWPSGSRGVSPTVLPVWSAVLGAEAGLRDDGFEARFSADMLLASAVVPFRWQTDLSGAFAVADGLAVQVGTGIRGGGLKFVDGDERSIGSRRDLDIRAQVGVAIWL